VKIADNMSKKPPQKGPDQSNNNNNNSKVTIPRNTAVFLNVKTGKEVKIPFNIFDNEYTIRDKLEIELEAPGLVSYNGISEYDSKTVEIRDIRSELRDEEDVEDFRNLYDPSKYNVKIYDAFLLWIEANFPESDKKLEERIVILSNNDLLENHRYNDLEAIERALKEYKGRRSRKLEEKRKRIKSLNEISNKVYSYASYKSSSFVSEQMAKVIPLESTSDISSIVSACKIDRRLPFCKVSYGDSELYFKCYKFLKPLEEWLTEKRKIPLKFGLGGSNDERSGTTRGSQIALMKVLSINESEFNEDFLTDFKTRKKYDNDYYSSIYLVHVRMPLLYMKVRSECDEMITERLRDSLNVKFGESEVINIRGYFTIDALNIRRLILLDLITNDPVFSSLFHVDEREKLSSAKKVFYIHYNPFGTGVKLSFSLSNNISQDGKKFLQVRVVRCSSLRLISGFIEIFSRLLKRYEELYDEVFEYYSSKIAKFNDFIKSYDKNLEDDSGSEQTKLKLLRTKDPKLFVADYGRRCQMQPTIIPDSEIAKYKAEGYQVMKFPSKHELKRNPSLKQWNLVCLDESAKYPGVRLNGLSNKKDYEYIPCCYPVDQSEKSKYVNYFSGVSSDVGGEETKCGYIIDTDKIVKKRGACARMPADAERYLIAIQISNLNIETKTPYRYGIMKSASSIIHCLCDALDDDYSKASNKEKYVNNVRKKLLDLNLELCKQELYNLSVEDIRNIISNPDAYLDASKFRRLLERHFKCNLFVMVRDERRQYGSFALPEFRETYLFPHFNKELVNIIVYQHAGGKADSLEHSHHELVIRLNENKDIIKTFSQRYGEVLHASEMELLGLFSATKAISKQSSALETLLPTGIGVKYQYIDDYGKGRAVMVSEDAILIARTIFAPLNLPSFSMKKAKRTSLAKARSLLQGEIQGILIKSGKLSGIYNANWIIMTELDEIPSDLREKHVGESGWELYYANLDDPYEKSKIQVKRENERSASILKSIILWRFSYWAKAGNVLVKPNDRAVIQRFIDECCVLVKDYKYDISSSELPREVPAERSEISQEVPIRSEYQNANLFRNGKLIVSGKLQEKIKYFLNISIRNNRDEVLSYYRKTNAEEYIMNEVPIKSNENEIIFSNRSVLLDWINKTEYNLMNMAVMIVDKNTIYPYLLKDLENNLYLIQNVKNMNLRRALAVARAWSKLKVNIGYSAPKFSKARESGSREHSQRSNPRTDSSPELPPHTIFKFSKGNIRPLMDEEIKDILILRYEKDEYAAILKLIKN
jgi:hypothetical protein